MQRIGRSTRDFIVGVCLVLAVVWCLIWFDLAQHYKDVQSTAQQAAVYRSEVFAQFTESTIKRLDDLLLDARDEWLQRGKDFDSRLQRRQAMMAELTFQVTVIDAEGYVAYTNLNANPGRVYLGDRAHFLVHRDTTADKLFISEPVKGKVSGRWSVQFTRPIFRQQRFAGVVVASASPDVFANFGRALGQSATGVIALVNPKGVLLARSPFRDQVTTIPREGTPYLNADAPMTGYFSRVSPVDVVERSYGFSRLPAFGLTAIIGEDTGVLMAPYYAYRTELLAMGLGASAALLALLTLLFRSQSRRDSAEAATQKALAELEILQICINKINDVVLITEAEPVEGPDGPRILYVNDAFERQTGFTREEALGKTPRILQGPKTQRSELDRLYQALKNWEHARIEVINYKKNGEEFWAEIDVMPVADETGWYTHWVSVERIVTEKKLAVEKLRAQEERLRGLYQLTSLGISLSDRSGKFIEFNHAFEQMCGYST
ncbi:MAG: PAS domain S-box protein [Rhodoferax sp.]